MSEYEIVRKLAQGGMAEIFLATQRTIQGFERPVVLKRVLPELAADATFVAAFLDEARLAAQLSHPNIVQVIELGERDGTYFLALELVDGVDLSTLLRGGALPLDVALTILKDVLSGLHFAHELNVVHRDATPSNVLVGFSGVAKIGDFGIAKVLSRIEGQTQHGVLKGKIGYVAPEQVRGEGIDRRVDVFACGIVLYEMVSGRHPFRGENEAATLNAIVSAAPSFAEVPEQVRGIVQRALSKRREERFATAAEMIAAIEGTGVGVSSFAVQRYLAARRETLGSVVKEDAKTKALGPSPSASRRSAFPSPARGEGDANPSPPAGEGSVERSDTQGEGRRWPFALAVLAVVIVVAWFFSPRPTPPPPPPAPASLPTLTLASLPRHVVTLDGGVGLAISPRRILTTVLSSRAECPDRTSAPATTLQHSDILGLAILELDRDCLHAATPTFAHELILGAALSCNGSPCEAKSLHLPPHGRPAIAIDTETTAPLGTPAVNTAGEIVGFVASRDRLYLHPSVYAEDAAKGLYSPELRAAAKAWR